MAAEKKIGTVVYRYESLTGWEAWDALQLLIKIVGPFLPLLEAVLQDNEDQRTVAIARILPEVMRSHDGERFRELLQMLFANCRANGDPVVVGANLAGIGAILELAAFCLQKEYADFFGGAGLKRLLALLPTAKSP